MKVVLGACVLAVAGVVVEAQRAGPANDGLGARFQSVGYEINPLSMFSKMSAGGEQSRSKR